MKNLNYNFYLEIFGFNNLSDPDLSIKNRFPLKRLKVRSLSQWKKPKSIGQNKVFKKKNTKSYEITSRHFFWRWIILVWKKNRSCQFRDVVVNSRPSLQETQIKLISLWVEPTLTISYFEYSEKKNYLREN